MTVQHDLTSVAPKSETAITIGVFDGVHLGHQHLLKRLIEASRSSGLSSLVLTFRNHPRSVLNPGVPVKYICDLDTRVALLQEMGVDQVVCIDFSLPLSLLKASEFVSMLVKNLRLRGLVVGPDFALGHRREGDIPTLRRLGKEGGFWVETVENISLGGESVRSSAIREALDQGWVDAVSRMLGRPFNITGKVIHGEHRGRNLGFPTANLSLAPEQAIPSDGIYATWAIVEGRRYQSATNIGVRPTFGTGQRLVESHLMDFDGDLYDKSLRLEFIDRLRDEMAFTSADALVEQIKLDVEQSRAILPEQGHAG